MYPLWKEYNIFLKILYKKLHLTFMTLIKSFSFSSPFAKVAWRLQILYFFWICWYNLGIEKEKRK